MKKRNYKEQYEQQTLFEGDFSSSISSNPDFYLVQPQSNIRVLSLFSGAGGLDLGFHKLGFDIVCAIEHNSLFCQTLEANKGTYISATTQVVCEDITQIDLDTLPKNIDLVIGGPPCQAFSASGRRAGGAAGRLDNRGTLFKAYSRIIASIKPKGFLFENVRGILGTHKGKDWQNIVQTFKEIGYNISYRILDACDYGIPQHRERLILVGHQLNDEFLFPRPSHGPDSLISLDYMSPIGAFEGIIDSEDVLTLTLTDGKYAHLLPLVPPGDNYLFFTKERGHKNPIFAYRSRFSDFLYKANPNYPVKTLIANPGKYTGPLHWDNRYFSIAEYKRLQGFPDDYIFCGVRADIIMQIGNSVSPLLSEALAQAIMCQIFGHDVDISLLSRDEQLSFDKRKSKKARKTRKYHELIASEQSNNLTTLFTLENYECHVTPCTYVSEEPNMSVTTPQNDVEITVYSDTYADKFVEMNLLIGARSKHQADTLFSIPVKIIVYGREPHAIQTMWNALDNWVIQSSSFHSLFELYGHFTEPHPIFSVISFKSCSNHPIADFAKHISNFNNCSKYFPKEQLVALFGSSFGVNDFESIAQILRKYRFDIRSHETNIAIPEGVYMVAYPFTLPYRKQMNFNLKDRNGRRIMEVVDDALYENGLNYVE